MNVERFTEEFRELWRRFTSMDADRNVDSTVGPLTNQEILDAVKEVLESKFDVTLVESRRDDVRTPASGIVFGTPNAPDIPKLNVENNVGMPGRFRSLDTLRAESSRDSPIGDLVFPEPGPLTAKVNDEISDVTLDVPDARNDAKKEMSKSSPSLNVLARSDTFVRDDEFEPTKNVNVGTAKNFETSATHNSFNEHSTTEPNLTELLKKLIILKDSATDVINKIDDMQNGVPEKCSSIRRLSAIGGFPGLNRTLTAAKSTQRSKVMRRSVAALPDTPTSSRLSPGAEAKNDALRRKSTSALSLVNIGGARLSIPAASRSVSSGSIVVPKNPSGHSTPAHASQLSGIKGPKSTTSRSPALSLLNVTNKSPACRQTKDSKYAHVQSTIPKSSIGLGKRKSTETLKH